MMDKYFSREQSWIRTITWAIYFSWNYSFVNQELYTFEHCRYSTNVGALLLIPIKLLVPLVSQWRLWRTDAVIWRLFSNFSNIFLGDVDKTFQASLASFGHGKTLPSVSSLLSEPNKNSKISWSVNYKSKLQTYLKFPYKQRILIT